MSKVINGFNLVGFWLHKRYDLCQKWWAIPIEQYRGKNNNPENFYASVPVRTEHQYSAPKMNIYYSYQKVSGTL